MGSLTATFRHRNADATLDLNRHMVGLVQKGVLDGDPQNPVPTAPLTLTGTITITNGSAAVVGVGTLFTTELAVGNSITAGTDPTVYQVLSITDGLNLTLTTVYTSPTQTGVAAYRVFPAGPSSLPPGVVVPRVVAGPGALQVTVKPFAAMSADGMLVSHEGTDRILTILASTVQYVVLRAKYVLGEDPVVSIEVLTATQYNSDPDRYRIFLGQPVDHLIVLAKIASTVSVTSGDLSFLENQVVNQLNRYFVRGHVASLAVLNSAPLNDPKVVWTGDIYYAEAEKQLFGWTGPSGSPANTWEPVGDQQVITDLADHLAVSAPLTGGFSGRDIAQWPAHPAKAVSFTPPGGSNIVATNVQDALHEVDQEKVKKAGDSMTGSLVIVTPAGTHNGLEAYGGTTGGIGVLAVGGGSNGQGVYATGGAGNGWAVLAEGTGNAAGVRSTGGPTGGAGIDARGGTSNGIGGDFTGGDGGTGLGARAVGGFSGGNGLEATGVGAAGIGVVASGTVAIQATGKVIWTDAGRAALISSGTQTLASGAESVNFSGVAEISAAGGVSFTNPTLTLAKGLYRVSYTVVVSDTNAAANVVELVLVRDGSIFIETSRTQKENITAMSGVKSTLSCSTLVNASVGGTLLVLRAITGGTATNVTLHTAALSIERIMTNS